jgi:hypothetical protein
MSRVTRVATTIVAVTLGVAALAGCQPASDTPTVIETPEIAWNSAPTGEFADDRYAQVVEAASLGFVLASNANDFTIAQLTETNTAARVQALYENHVDQYVGANARPIAWAGPLPRTVLDVTENAAGDGAEVLVCDVSTDWFINDAHPEPTIDDVTPLSLIFTIVTEDGTLKVDSTESGGGECEPGEVPLGRFEPEPEPAGEITEDSIRAPLGSD